MKTRISPNQGCQTCHGFHTVTNKKHTSKTKIGETKNNKDNNYIRSVLISTQVDNKNRNKNKEQEVKNKTTNHEAKTITRTHQVLFWISTQKKEHKDPGD